MVIDTAKNWLGGFDHADSVSNMMQQGQIPHQMYAQGGKIEEVQFEHVWVQAYINDQWQDLDALCVSQGVPPDKCINKTIGR